MNVCWMNVIWTYYSTFAMLSLLCDLPASVMLLIPFTNSHGIVTCPLYAQFRNSPEEGESSGYFLLTL